MRSLALAGVDGMLEDSGRRGKRRAENGEGAPPPKRSLPEAVAAARLRALGLQHDHRYGGNGLPQVGGASGGPMGGRDEPDGWGLEANRRRDEPDGRGLTAGGANGRTQCPGWAGFRGGQWEDGMNRKGGVWRERPMGGRDVPGGRDFGQANGRMG
ncbi:collagen alpha-2(I) chain-like [Phasianus colchicus]|uniref:collagen alpha-2(I) chain-like n=1 Tax=Phasianus colchicus TaxID=9054 RepID=UPI00129DDC0B|nr:collagen alpha-2(I) chain-like [Phasianus colchicus]